MVQCTRRDVSLKKYFLYILLAVSFSPLPAQAKAPNEGQVYYYKQTGVVRNNNKTTGDNTGQFISFTHAGCYDSNNQSQYKKFYAAVAMAQVIVNHAEAREIARNVLVEKSLQIHITQAEEKYSVIAAFVTEPEIAELVTATENV
jgi:hypothetical protein